MPYKDPEKQKEAKRLYYLARYNSDPAFKEAEAARKAKWLEQPTAKRKNRQASKRARKKAGDS